MRHRTRSNPGPEQSQTEQQLRFALSELNQAMAFDALNARIPALRERVAALRAKMEAPRKERRVSDSNDGEDVVSDEIEAMIKAHPQVWMCERRNSGTMKLGDRHIAFSRFIKLPTGIMEGWEKKIRVPDYSGILKNGKIFVIEAKKRSWHMTPSDYHAKEQHVYIRAIIAVGGFAGFARSAIEAKNILEGK